MQQNTFFPPVTLQNCEDEPIHLPGSIQPHGALLGFDAQARLLTRSGNAETLLGPLPPLGEGLAETHLSPQVRAFIARLAAGDDTGMETAELTTGAVCYDVVAHWHEGVLLAEFEARPADAPPLAQFALQAHRTISRIQRHRELQGLLEEAVEEIRRMTGFDRVMAYRFRSDDSGEVVAEARRDDLVSYRGQRYPASDIPAQARRLYVVNAIRLIADVGYRPVPLEPQRHPVTGAPFDLSHSVLRSVSPIHCEYLGNMGVAASMSISIVIDGRLWGLFACHHMTPRVVAHAVRMAAQLLSQMCGVVIERVESANRRALQAQVSERRTALVEAAMRTPDLVHALTRNALNVRHLVPCDAAAVLLKDETVVLSDAPLDAFVGDIVRRLEDETVGEVFHTDHWTPTAGVDPHGFFGVLAIPFSRDEGGWVIWLRQEQVQSVKWGGKPEKSLSYGPSGARLTPRGSFDAWTEVVRETSLPWLAEEVEQARALRGELVELCLSRLVETDRMRHRFLAMLGHDLRDPLQAISMAAGILTRSSHAASARMGGRIGNASRRMERLITQLLDLSRLQAGLGLPLNRSPQPLTALTEELLQEVQLAYPQLALHAALAPDLSAQVDPDRYGQMLLNLVSNARSHSKPGMPITVSLAEEDGQAVLAVGNASAPLPPGINSQLYKPFKSGGPNARNKGGLGLGLFITYHMAAAHSGHLALDYQDGRVVATLRLPLQPPV